MSVMTEDIMSRMWENGWKLSAVVWVICGLWWLYAAPAVVIFSLPTLSFFAGTCVAAVAGGAALWGFKFLINAVIFRGIATEARRKTAHGSVATLFAWLTVTHNLVCWFSEFVLAYGLYRISGYLFTQVMFVGQGS